MGKNIYEQGIDRGELIKPAPVAWLGPDGTFTKMAGDRYVASRDGRVALSEAETSIANIFNAVREGRARYGVVPIDNSTAGPVKDSHRELSYHDGIVIVGEIVLPIRHVLYMRSDAIVKTIASKDQALAQCERNLNTRFPHTKRLELDSTAEAVRQAAENPTIAAIGSAIAAKALGLEDQLVRVDCMEDNPGNATTFAVIAKRGTEEPPATGKDKTTVIMDLPDRPGGLFTVLSELYAQGVNLTKIKSLQRFQGHVWFWFSIDGHQTENHVRTALAKLESNGYPIKRLGSYPKAEYSPEKQPSIPNIENAIKMIKKEVQNGNGNGNHDQTTLVFTLPNVPGALARALAPFAQRKVNLTTIDSQPSGNLDEYIFYLAFENDGVNKEELIANLQTRCSYVQEITY